ncbi:hypothetical protein WJX81_003502 [Elliptochloris bilobata]|uniref:Uncharacterized protein n=1 Tax=Elliptochloris bilobata TaxID=381761 RepID=A0AAW1S1V5_9CHLO
MVCADASDGADHFAPSLFTNESYELREFVYGQHTLRVLCSPAASTDYDLTGLVLWPAAHLLAEYMAANMAHLAACNAACELGAGLGLVGLLAGKACPVMLTDHNEVVLRVLQRNAAENPGPHSVRCMQLDWGDDHGIAAVLHASPDGQGYDLVLSSDVAYSLKALPALFCAAARLLARRPGAEFWLGYVSRAAGIDRGIHTEAAAAGLHMREVPGTRQRVAGGLEGVVFRCRHKEPA